MIASWVDEIDTFTILLLGPPGLPGVESSRAGREMLQQVFRRCLLNS